MNDEITEIDALGLLCPLPVLRLRKRLKALPKDALACLIADDPAAIVDVPHFCNESGHSLLETTEVDGTLKFLIQRK